MTSTKDSIASPWLRLKNSVRQQQGRFDQQIQSDLNSYRQQGGRIFCGKGCRNCCTLTVNSGLTEALLVAEALIGPQPALEAYICQLRRILSEAADLKSYLRMQRNQLGACPFLDADGTCGVYAVRPFACRALFSTRPAAWCDVDFATLPAIEKQLFMVSLDRSVVDFPTHYLAGPRKTGQQMETEAADAMSTEFKISILGNLPYLVWLERRYGLSAVAEKGPAAVRSLLEAENLFHPYLIILDT
jgi:Fe-S-cluster containining protein